MKIKRRMMLSEHPILLNQSRSLKILITFFDLRTVRKVCDLHSIDLAIVDANQIKKSTKT